MKKGLVIGLAVLMIFGLGTIVALAADPPTTVDITWGGGTVDTGGYPVDFGAGWITGTVTAPHATTTFQSNAGLIMGRFKANYAPGVGHAGACSYSTSMEANVENGIMEFYTDRLPGGYIGGTPAPGGENSYSFIGTGYYSAPDTWVPSAGWASMASASNTLSYPSPHTGGNDNINDNTYSSGTKALTYSHNFQANADDYTIIRQMTASDGDYVQATAVGGGTAVLDCGGSSASATQANLAYRSGYNFGWNQDFTATGAGKFAVEGSGNNEVVKYLGYTVTGFVTYSPHTADASGLHNDGTGAPGSAFLGMYGGWTGGGAWSITNYSMTAK